RRCSCRGSTRSRRRACRRGSWTTSVPFLTSAVSQRQRTSEERARAMQPTLFSRVVVYMRRLLVVLALVSVAAFSQTPPGRRPPGPRPYFPGAESAESMVKQSMERLANERKSYERDAAVLGHLRTADDALVDNMQPSNAIQKAYEEVIEAKRLGPDFTVLQGAIAAERELEGARRSPISADFGHLRTVVRNEALGPATRVVIRNAQRLQEETVAWMKVQELIATHVRTLSDIASQSLQASQK